MSDTCDLCGLPLRGGTVELQASNRTYRFCCHGCKQVFSILSQSPDAKDAVDFKSTELFRKCQAMGIIPKVAPDDSNEPIGQISSITLPEHALTLHLTIDGMWCPSCAWLVDKAVGQVGGIYQSTCMFSTDTLRCEYDPTRTSPQTIIEGIRKVGYNAQIPGDDDEKRKDRSELIRFGISAFLTMNVMMLSVALYSGFFQDFSRESINAISTPIFFMATAVFFYGGSHIHQRAWRAVTTGAYGMETLISLGSSVAYGYSLWRLLEGSLHLYFDTATMLITLVLLGKMLETGAKKKIQADLSHFLNLAPKKVRLCTRENSEGRYVSADGLKKGDSFRLEAGEIAPADGAITRGEGIVDESHLTGEPVPKPKRIGERLVSGARLTSGVLYVKADQVGKDATLGQMVDLIEVALGRKTPLESQTDRLLRWFVPGVVSLAFMTAFFGFGFGLTVDDAFTRAITVLVISCPCALGIAIPLTRVAGLSVSGKQGILVRDFSAFDNSKRLNRFIFDKTGTITAGQWRLSSITPVAPYTEPFVISLASGLEREVDHILAVEIQRYAKDRSIVPAHINEIESFENGRSGMFEDKKVKIGAKTFVVGENSTVPVDNSFQTPLLKKDVAKSNVYLSIEGEPAAVFSFGDTIRPEAYSTLAALSKIGYRLCMVSGDGSTTTRFVASQVGIEDALGEKFPQDKMGIVQNFQVSGERIAMVGDGVNDAPAMAQSDLAIAVKADNPLGKETADITLMRGELSQIIDFLTIAKDVRKKVLQNLTFTFVYNAVSIPIAMTGLLSPPIAVCAMLMSSLSVIGNTLLLVRKYGPKTQQMD